MQLLYAWKAQSKPKITENKKTKQKINYKGEKSVGIRGEIH